MDKIKYKNKKIFSFIFILLIVTLVSLLGVGLIPKTSQKVNSGNDVLSTYSSSDVFKNFKDRLATWSADYRIQSCSAEPISSIEIKGELKRFVGQYEGAFASWHCNVFSPSKKQILTALWSRGEVELSAPIAMNDNFVGLIEAKPYFNELEEVVDSTKIYDLIESEFDEDNHFYTLSIGEDTIRLFDAKYVWKVSIFNREELEDNGTNKLVQDYYFDAKNATAIQ